MRINKRKKIDVWISRFRSIIKVSTVMLIISYLWILGVFYNMDFSTRYGNGEWNMLPLVTPFMIFLVSGVALVLSQEVLREIDKYMEKVNRKNDY